MIKGVSNRVGVIEVLIVGCSDAMTRCPRTGCGDQVPYRVEGTESGYWISELGQDLTVLSTTILMDSRIVWPSLISNP